MGPRDWAHRQSGLVADVLTRWAVPNGAFLSDYWIGILRVITKDSLVPCPHEQERAGENCILQGAEPGGERGGARLSGSVTDKLKKTTSSYYPVFKDDLEPNMWWSGLYCDEAGGLLFYWFIHFYWASVRAADQVRSFTLLSRLQ